MKRREELCIHANPFSALNHKQVSRDSFKLEEVDKFTWLKQIGYKSIEI